MKLKVNKKFTPCPIDDGDELFPNGIFEFNITKMFSFIEKNPDKFALEQVSVTEFNQNFLISMNLISTLSIFVVLSFLPK